MDPHRLCQLSDVLHTLHLACRGGQTGGAEGAGPEAWLLWLAGACSPQAAGSRGRVHVRVWHEACAVHAFDGQVEEEFLYSLARP